MTDQPIRPPRRLRTDGAYSDLILVVETANGPYVRQIPSALPLPADMEHGRAAETAAHSAAATWGMPDFVYRNAHVSKGSGTRELGDLLLLAGHRGAVVQVKARTIAPKGDDQERFWIQKVAAKAMKQAKGTVRQLRLLPAEMSNGRGRILTVDGNAYEWIAVFLLDHNQVPAGTVASWEPVGMPALALTRRDWDFLFDHLRSMTAVLDYLFRSAAAPTTALGDEPLRYYEFAAADAMTPPADIDTHLVQPGDVTRSIPPLPQAPVDDGKTRAHLVVRMVMEHIATLDLPDHAAESDRLTVLSDLDQLPPGVRAEWGQLLLDMLDDVSGILDGLRWRCRRQLNADATRQILWTCWNQFDSNTEALFASFVMLRHHEIATRIGRADELATVGVLLTPHYGGRRPWNTTMIRTHGRSNLTSEQVAELDRLWNHNSRWA
ncbi:hypothetical protein [Streptomyces sp. CA-111067]|uniref:hypothetical protein n=1 Tax=Streptomyces sp. CA-111067 TaxID=3240046 RepID=UPI003D98964A